MEDQLLELIQQSLENKPIWAIFVALLGGVVSSISPCVLSTLPIMIGYIGGYSDDKVSKAFIQSLLFVIGFTITLTVVGLIAASAGTVIGGFLGPAWFICLGLLAIAMGLALLELFYIPFPTIIKDVPKNKYGKIFSPIIVGMAFGLIATPCSTPILLALVGFVAYESYEESFLFGLAMLISYAFGHSLILLVCGTFTGLLKKVCEIRKWTTYITKGSGILLILVGIYLLVFAILPLFNQSS